MTVRTERLRRASLDAIPSISDERARITTAFYKEHLGRHSVPVMRALNFLPSASEDAGGRWRSSASAGPREGADVSELTCHFGRRFAFDARPKTSYAVESSVIETYERDIVPF
jgi:formate C-acetyltransferase